MFREHIAIGAIASTLVCVAVYAYALITDPWLLVLLFFVTTIGSFLPDVDSDSGLPFYLVYGTATVAATGIVLLYTLSSPYANDWRYLVGIPLAALAIFWFVVGSVVKRCTHHRGIFHSIPALAIASVATFLLAERYGLESFTALVFGVGMGIGFATHLVLDEMHSLVDLEGMPFLPKKSLGTAFKLFSGSARVNLAAYLVLTALVYTAYTSPAFAYYYNDTDVIEIQGGTPRLIPEHELGVGAVTPGGYIVRDNTPPQLATTTPGQNPTAPVTPTITTVDPQGPHDPQSGPIDTDEELFNLLLKDGALSGSSLTEIAGDGSASTFFEDLFSDEGVGGIWSGFVVSGSRVRDLLSGKYDLREMLQAWRKGKSGAHTARGYGLIAASTALGDRNIDSIAFGVDAFEITYRSRGYLFSIIPISFPVRVGVIPGTSSDRVTVKLPWYRFFVRELFTPRKLTEEINTLIEETIKNADPKADLRAVLLTSVADFLKAKIGTIGGTVSGS